MRIPTWFLLAWVVLISALALGSSVLAYGFVRDRAAELDSVIDLPDPPDLGHSEPERPTQTPIPTAIVENATPDPAGNDLTATEQAPDGDATAPDVTQVAAQDVQPDTAQIVAEADPADQYIWDDPRRVTILLMGIDQRAGETGAFPTDTIMLLSLDPVGKTGAILSIPRDLWVEYPGLSTKGKINGANIMGNNINYPGGGGPAFAVKAVEKELGIRVPYYVLINFEVFYTFIDAIGPIEVCPTDVIHDDKYPDGSYGYMTVHFDPGCQELDSERLLQYARVRHSDSDIGRANRQQEVILAVRQKVLTTGGVTSLIPQAPDLWNAMKDNIQTNLTFEDMMGLARKAEEISSENIRQDQISFEDVTLGTSPDGEEILIPISSDIRSKVANLFRPADTP
ncbi:MAG: LCP family protein [Anaerolineae bacterium]|nr:LCP family protein [Anaerolineae bacterium]